MSMPRAKNIIGVVVPTAWDDVGKVTAVGISAIDEVEYLLAEGPQSCDLLGLVRREVEVTGVVTEHAGGVKKIHLENYKLIRRDEQNEIA
jgi:hypothetical protein